MSSLVYVDASALVKVVVVEAESSAVRAYFASRPRQVSSVLVRVELGRAVARRPVVDLGVISLALDQLSLLDLDAAVIARALTIGPPELRTLDAIHLASALELGTDLEAVVTYDARLAAAARAAGLSVVSPGLPSS